MGKNEKSLTEQVHEATHRVPGVPEHSKAERLNSRGGLPNRPLENKPLQGDRSNHPNRKPRVLVNWQQKIARFFGVR